MEDLCREEAIGLIRLDQIDLSKSPLPKLLDHFIVLFEVLLRILVLQHSHERLVNGHVVIRRKFKLACFREFLQLEFSREIAFLLVLEQPGQTDLEVKVNYIADY